MTDPIEIAVVGHTNAGKTSLVRTLTRKRDFGKVSDSPGTTRAIEMFEIKVDGKGVVRYFDTPGLEDALYLERYFQDRYSDVAEPLERFDAFLKGPEAQGTFEQAAKVLRIMRKINAALYVIDCRDEVLPKFKAEIRLLRDCGKPILPVLNFCRQATSNEARWLESLNAYGLHAFIKFDAAAPFIGSEERLYSSLRTLLPEFSGNIQEVMDDIELRYLERRSASCRLIANLLISTAALRQEIDKRDLNDSARKNAFMKSFQEVPRTNVRHAVMNLFEIHGFGKNDSDVTIAPWMAGRWDSDIFDEKILKDAAKRLGMGVFIGAAIGAAIFAAPGGVAAPLGGAIGAGIGGLASQGVGPLAIKMKNKMRGINEVTVEDAVLLVIAENLTDLSRLLEDRGHASLDKVTLTAEASEPSDDSAKAISTSRKAALQHVVRELRSARAAPHWADSKGRDDDDRRKLSRAVEDILLRILVRDAR